MNPRRLYRSRNRTLAGVAGGMAEYLDVDPTVMRIVWILVGLLSAGFAIIAYVLLALVIPDAPWSATPPAPPTGWGQPNPAPASGWAPAAGGWTPSGQGWDTTATQAWTSYPPAAGSPSSTPGWTTASAAPAGAWTASGAAPQPRAEGRGIGASMIIGVVLVAIGSMALVNVAVPGWLAPAAFGPAILITIGAAILVVSVRRNPSDAPSPVAEGPATAPASASTPAAAAPGSVVAADEAETTSIEVPVAAQPAEARPEEARPEVAFPSPV